VPWFVIAFCLMLLFVPWMNYLAHGMSRRSYSILLALGFVLLSVASSVTGSSFINSNLTWFLYLYLAGGFVRIHGIGVKTSILVILLVAMALFHSAAVAALVLEGGIKEAVIVNGVWTSRNSITVFLMAALILVLFERLDLGSRPTLNRIASASFGVYLISDNPFVRAWLWAHFAQLASGGVLILALGGCLAALVVYAICTCMELIRSTLSKRIAKSMPRLSFARVCKRIDGYYSNVTGGADV